MYTVLSLEVFLVYMLHHHRCVCGSFIFRGKESSAKFREESLTPVVLEIEIIDEEPNKCYVDDPANLHFLLIPNLLKFNPLTFSIQG
jgi:hypothetical protein